MQSTLRLASCRYVRSRTQSARQIAKLKNDLKAKNEKVTSFFRKACDLGSVNGGQAEACHRYAAMFIKVATFFCIRIILILTVFEGLFQFPKPLPFSGDKRRL